MATASWQRLPPMVPYVESARREAQLGAVLSAVTDAVLLTQVDGAIFRMNATAERLLDIDEREAMGRPLASLLRLRDSTGALLRPEAASASGEPVRLVVARRAERAVRVRRTTFTAHGERGTVWVLADGAAHAELAARLREAERLELLGRVVANVARDLEAQLASIIELSVASARHLHREAPLCSLVERVRNVGDRALRLTRSLVGLARRQAPAPRAVDVHGLLRALERAITRDLPGGVRLFIRAEAESATLLGDPAAIEALLRSLVANAVDAMPEGGTIAISTASRGVGVGLRAPIRHMPPPAPCFEVCVTDNGVGMAKEVLAQLFDGFFTTKEARRGGGLGLAVVDAVVAEHQGAIAYESASGRGTRVRMWFPLAPASATDRPSSAPPAESSSPPARRSTMRPTARNG